MLPSYIDIEELLYKRADLKARLKLLPYQGSPEIKTQGKSSFLYVRKCVDGKLTSTYVGPYSYELYNQLLKNAQHAILINRELRKIERKLLEANYIDQDLPLEITRNIDFARANLKINIYDQAVLEGVGTSFPQTEEIIENSKVNGVLASDVLKILNLKHAWEFILDKDVISCRSDYYLLSRIAELVNEGFYMDGGRIRGVPVTIGGTSYIPPLPNELEVKEKILEILSSNDEVIDKAIKICLYSMKTQIFLDGNKRAAVIFANHYLIANGGGILVIPEKHVPEFKKLLISYYEGEDIKILLKFMKDKCRKRF